MVYVTAAKAQREFGLFGVTSAIVRALLLGAALYTTTHYKNTACKTSSRTTYTIDIIHGIISMRTQTGSFPSRLYARIQATATAHAQFIGLNTGS